MTALKRRIVDQEDGCYWVLYGPHGVISWCRLNGEEGIASHDAVGVHSPRPQYDGHNPTGDCPFLEGTCYVDMSDSGGVWIGSQWEEADFDDEVIWRWLQEWYRDFLASEARAR